LFRVNYYDFIIILISFLLILITIITHLLIFDAIMIIIFVLLLVIQMPAVLNVKIILIDLIAFMIGVLTCFLHQSII
jgi:hypothetical protein